MWVELYKTSLEKVDPTLPDIESNQKIVVKSFGKAVQTQFICFIKLEPTILDNKKYHEVTLTADPGVNVYITEKDYERIIH